MQGALPKKPCPVRPES
jgi:hypothetical protein